MKHGVVWSPSLCWRHSIWLGKLQLREMCEVICDNFSNFLPKKLCCNIFGPQTYVAILAFSCWTSERCRNRPSSDLQVEGWLSRSEQLVRYFYNAAPLGVAYCLAKPHLALMQRQLADLPCLSASAYASTADNLTLLIKASATVTVS